LQVILRHHTVLRFYMVHHLATPRTSDLNFFNFGALPNFLHYITISGLFGVYLHSCVSEEGQLAKIVYFVPP